MARFDYCQLDVFARRRGGGNPLGVVLDARDWSERAMQGFACWTNLVETTFVLPAGHPDADYRVRIFTPQREIAFAGHPTVGTAHALLESGRLQPRGGRVVQECAAGLLPVQVQTLDQAQALYVQAPGAQLIDTASELREQAQAILGDLKTGALPIACVEGGRRWWIAELADESELRSWRPDHAAIKQLADATGTLGLCVFARCQAIAGEIAVRAFPAGVGIVEDPASGAANGLIAAWIALCEPQGPLAHGYRVSQGREIGHDARIDIIIEANRTVWVGGATNTIVRGQIEWEHDL